MFYYFGLTSRAWCVYHQLDEKVPARTGMHEFKMPLILTPRVSRAQIMCDNDSYNPETSEMTNRELQRDISQRRKERNLLCTQSTDARKSDHDGIDGDDDD
jgi:hypothetical protein